jgi:Cdc25 family phosphatase
MEAHLLYTHHNRTSKPNKTRFSTTTMSNITLSDLSHISREELADTLLSSSSQKPTTSDEKDSTTTTTSTTTQTQTQTPPSNIAIVDVRDSDHVGGHIRGSTWVPSSELDFRVPELIRTLKDKEVVVFHCALSQQRGPSAALRYLREKRRIEGEGKGEQKVVVLDGGFTKWQEKYGEDERLTEGYQKDVWEFGY